MKRYVKFGGMLARNMDGYIAVDFPAMLSVTMVDQSGDLIDEDYSHQAVVSCFLESNGLNYGPYTLAPIKPQILNIPGTWIYVYSIVPRYDTTNKLLVFNMLINTTRYPYINVPTQFLLATIYMDPAKRVTPVGSYTVRRVFDGYDWSDVTGAAHPLYVTVSV